MGSHDSMVPFWQRRLLAVTLPAVALLTAMAATAMDFATYWIGFERMNRMPGTEPTIGGPLLFGAIVGVLIPPPVLFVARLTPRSKRGTGYWITRLILPLPASVVVWLMAWTTAWTLAPSLVPNSNAMSVSVLGISVVLAMLLSVNPKPDCPRTAAIQRLASRFCFVCLCGLACVVPALFAMYTDFTDTADPMYGTLWLTTEMLLQTTSLLACSLLVYAAVAFFARQLTLRHAPYHATHCHHCGYDLAYAESKACPECNTPVTQDQLAALASLSNGPQPTGSSPTSST